MIEHGLGSPYQRIGTFLLGQGIYQYLFPILASLVLLDVGFYYLDWYKSFIHVMRDNPKAIEYVHQIGYKLCDGQEKAKNQLIFSPKKTFEKKGRKMRQAAETFKERIQ